MLPPVGYPSSMVARLGPVGCRGRAVGLPEQRRLLFAHFQYDSGQISGQAQPQFAAVRDLANTQKANSNWRQATPLLMAVGHAAHFRVADQLLKAGADPNQGTSILHASCAWHFEHLVPALRYLTESGWDVNSRDSSGQTALHKAAFLGYAKRQFEPSWSRAPIRMRRTHRG